MAVLRILLTWLLLAALPLQGFAGATTLLCGPAHHGAVASATGGPGGDGHPAAIDGDRHHHDHASTHRVNEGEADAAVAAQALQGTGHSCSLCSAACHGLGIASQPAQVALASAPRVPLDEAFQRLASRPAPVPDKPPRA